MATKARRRARLSILDMSIEDDSLLPRCSVILEDEDPPQEMREQGSQEIVEESSIPVAPVAARKIKKHHNLRKSLAWDKAFLTGEGVLDQDELPISTRSPKRLPELPTLDVRSSTIQEECETSADSGNKESLRMRSFSERFDSRCNPLDTSNVQGSQFQASVPRCAPAKKAIESAIEKGTRLRLPSTFIADDRKSIPRPLNPQQESNLTKRVTSVSRRVRDTLGRVLPGRVQVSVAREGEACSMESCAGSDAHDNISSSVLEAADAECDANLGNDFRQQAVKGRVSLTEDMRLKPSGLRMPSPKLGFFDIAKPASRGAVRIPNCQKNFKTKPHGLPKGKPSVGPACERSIPVAPHIRKAAATEQENLKMTDENSSSSGKDLPVQPAKTPLAVNCGLLNSGPSIAKERSLFAIAKKAVGRLSSPVQNQSSRQEKRKPWVLGDDVSSIDTGTVNEDEKLVKTGPVQHSPPNKSAPQIGPWSPVRKNVTQLGPFDCTKSNAQVTWEI